MRAFVGEHAVRKQRESCVDGGTEGRESQSAGRAHGRRTRSAQYPLCYSIRPARMSRQKNTEIVPPIMLKIVY